MLTEQSILEELSKSERLVYYYIKEKASQNDNQIQESMDSIGDAVGVSEATVHRTIRKLKKEGVIGILPTPEKSDANIIKFFGIPDPKKQVTEIFDMISSLNLNAKRFENILEQKDQEIEKLKQEIDTLYKEIEKYKKMLASSSNISFDGGEVVKSEPLGNNLYALIVKKNK